MINPQSVSRHTNYLLANSAPFLWGQCSNNPLFFQQVLHTQHPQAIPKLHSNACLQYLLITNSFKGACQLVSLPHVQRPCQGWIQEHFFPQHIIMQRGCEEFKCKAEIIYRVINIPFQDHLTWHPEHVQLGSHLTLLTTQIVRWQSKQAHIWKHREIMKL